MLIGTFCTLLTAAGLGVAFLVAKRRRYATALRVAAFSLLPLGLAMTGVVRFVLNMTFNPVAWAGLGVIGLALLIFFVAGFADRRGGGGAGQAAAEPAGQAPALPAKRGRAAAAAAPADDFSDIEAILKKHGI
ncbi:hypothetical protein AB0O69_15645 [Streptomyces xiamenensis]|uniref:hypothetical protein n=1 Tax=Streptomyces xiamenensis TaxID=408015 RepID=UPI003421DDB2